MAFALPGGIKHHVSLPVSGFVHNFVNELPCELLPRRAPLDRANLCSGGLGELHHRQANRPRAHHQRALSRLQIRAAYRVRSDAQRLHQRKLLQAELV